MDVICRNFTHNIHRALNGAEEHKIVVSDNL